MALLPTAHERIDAALNLARTRAAAHAESGNSELAYRTLLRGVRTAQRTNNSSSSGMLLRRVWATPGVKTTALGAAPVVAAAVGLLRKSKSSGTGSPARSSDASMTSLDSSGQKRARFRVRPQRRGGVVVEDQTTTPAP
jgi:hypothetical protein